MSLIKSIYAIEILDSRGNPTIQTTVICDDGVIGTASVPSGASVGTFEAVELKDNDPNRYNGMGVLKAIDNIQNIISPKIIGMDAEDQNSIDNTLIELDATSNKTKLGANATLAVSMAVAKAKVASKKIPLYKSFQTQQPYSIPTPVFNVLNGGKHAGGNVDIQEFMIIPNTDGPYRAKLEKAVRFYHALKQLLIEKNLTTTVGDEGGFAPSLQRNEEALELFQKTIEQTNLQDSIRFGIDAASNTFYKDGAYHLKDSQNPLSTEDLISYYKSLQKKFNLLYLEDGLNENDFDGWGKLASALGTQTLIVGDDLVVTNSNRLQKAIDQKAISAIIIKPNQIGTITETLAVIKLAKESGIKTVVSHRSGETTDTFIADFAVGVGADFVKFGAPARGERVVKYNRLLEIEQEIKSQ